jgi:hypothetical protein
MKFLSNYLNLIIFAGIYIFFITFHYYDELAKIEEIIPKKLTINSDYNLLIGDDYKLEAI